MSTDLPSLTRIQDCSLHQCICILFFRVVYIILCQDATSLLNGISSTERTLDVFKVMTWVRKNYYMAQNGHKSGLE